MSSATWDYVIVGAGVAGSVIASRLRQYKPSLKILLLEAGTDTRAREDIVYANANPVGTELDWQFETAAIPGLNERKITIAQGKGLGGGAAINMAIWTRGSSHEYDDWARLVDDDRWSFHKQVPYMKMSETWFDKENPDRHGTSGPIVISSTSSTGREYPLRHAVAESWQSLGIKPLPSLDGQGGDNLGYAMTNEARNEGRRQLPVSSYPMEGVTIRVNAFVAKILSQPNDDGSTHRATGVLLADGEEIHANNVVCCAGAFQSPKLLMLSGIGARGELEAHGIDVKVDLPEVGENLGDHLVFFQYWKLKNPEKGHVLGSSNPLFQQPQFGLGVPIDWIVCDTVDKDKLAQAIEKDEGVAPSPSHPLLSKDRSSNELLMMYLAINPADPVIHPDGTHLQSAVIALLPTSRGNVSLRSADARDAPVITPNYLATEVDRYSYREGVRSMAKMMRDTAFGKEFIAGETTPNGVEPVTADVSDAYLDRRIADGATTLWHPHGGCSMGKVVDSKFKVEGFDNLFVIDSSVIPVALTAHLMAPVYGMAEQAARILVEREM